MDIVNLYYITSAKGHCFERNKESSSFHTNNDTIIVRCFAFLYFPAVNIKFFYLPLEIFFLEIWLVFCGPNCYVTLKLFSLFHFNEIYFFEWSRYLFSKTYNRSFLMILYPCQQMPTVLRKSRNIQHLFMPLCQSIALINFSAALSFSSKYILAFSQN